MKENGVIIITMPSNINWNKKELDAVKDYNQVMNFKVSNFPLKTKKGDKCYLCYKGQIIGWMDGWKKKHLNVQQQEKNITGSLY